MKKLSLVTLMALLLSGSAYTQTAQARAGTSENTVTGEEQERIDRQQMPSENGQYHGDDYDPRYEEGTLKEKQAREKAWEEEQKAKNQEAEDQLDESESDMQEE